MREIRGLKELCSDRVTSPITDGPLRITGSISWKSYCTLFNFQNKTATTCSTTARTVSRPSKHLNDNSHPILLGGTKGAAFLCCPQDATVLPQTARHKHSQSSTHKVTHVSTGSSCLKGKNKSNTPPPFAEVAEKSQEVFCCHKTVSLIYRSK